MAKIEDQRIMIWCNRPDELKSTILNAIHLALKLEKEICLFANYTSEKEKISFNKTIQVYAQTIKEDLPNLETSTLLLPGKLQNLMSDLGEKFNAILFCCNGELNRTLLKAFYRSPFPFFFSKQPKDEKRRLKNIIIPIDFRNSTKDSILWGSYLGRFNQSNIVLHTANDTKDSDNCKKVDQLIAFVNRFYNQFHFNFQFQKGKSGSWKIHTEAMKRANDFDLLIFTGSLNVSLIDQIIGPFEKRTINKATSSVLLINPQKEMYMLCN